MPPSSGTYRESWPIADTKGIPVTVGFRRGRVWMMKAHSFADTYELLSDGELLRLALTPEDLIDEARLALHTELQKRGLEGDEQVSVFRRQEQETLRENEREMPRLGLLSGHGIGHESFCRWAYAYDSSSGLEKFRTTVFVVLFWLPLIPIGTYEVEKLRKDPSTELSVVERLPLDWNQVLWVWSVTIAVLLAIFWGIKLMLFLSR